MNVLVTVASKHGATMQIAEAIGRALAKADIGAEVVAPDEVRSLKGYDAVILGSAVYAGRWLDEAKRFVEREAPALAERPVWLFSSGPIGDPPKPEEEPIDVAPIRAGDRQGCSGRGGRLPAVARDRGVGRRDRRDAQDARRLSRRDAQPTGTRLSSSAIVPAQASMAAQSRKSPAGSALRAAGIRRVTRSMKPIGLASGS